jgi:hypothetical protein
MTDLLGNKDALIEAVIEWVGDRSPDDPGDARLMQAIWRYSGPNVEPCPECDGDCGEPCAPCSVEAACANLDHFIERWMKKHGITTVAEAMNAAGAK